MIALCVVGVDDDEEVELRKVRSQCRGMVSLWSSEAERADVRAFSKTA